jgi:hypothetical protein
LCLTNVRPLKIATDQPKKLLKINPYSNGRHDGFSILSKDPPYMESINIEKSLMYEKWRIAMAEQIEMLNIVNAFDLEKQEAGMRVLSARWVFVVKLRAARDRYMACYVVSGCNQIPGQD